MTVEHHSLINEFPALRDRIHALKTGNPEFARLYREYQEIDKAVYRIEEGIETPSDDYTEDLKRQRVRLKDRLFALLNAA